VSPHAPYTVSPRLFDEVAARMRRHAPWTCSVHWAETDEEADWLAHGTGPLEGLLGAPGARATNDLARLAALDLIGPRTSLVHANRVTAADLDLIAASGAALVHCPGTHAFFGRAPFPFDEVLARGIPLALGTDSLASNAELDMLRELALLRRSAPGLAPRSVWRAATEGGARAIGCAGRAGVLEAGAWADLAAFETREPDDDALEALTTGAAHAVATWVAGRGASAEPSARGSDGA
jgi:cytosine/adenosine deaminase-related metal-dependent hydrolase